MRHSHRKGPPLTSKAISQAVARLDEQLEKAKANAKLLEEQSGEVDEVRELLKDLPGKATHPVMVPFGPLAFFDGYLEHTNDVLVQLSSEYFVLRTANHAAEMLGRRQARIRENQRSVGREVHELTEQRRVAAGESAASSALPPSAPMGATCQVDEEGFVDIREPYTEEDSGLGVPGGVGHGDSGHSGEGACESWGSDVLDKLRELERLDAEEELRDLDDLMASYERGELPEGSQPSTKGTGVSAASADDESACEAAGVALGYQVNSPADLQRLMGSMCEASPPPPVPTAAESIRTKDDDEGTAFSGNIRERGGGSGNNPPGDGREAPSSTTAQAAPKRISKFKADRLRSRA